MGCILIGVRYLGLGTIGNEKDALTPPPFVSGPSCFCDLLQIPPVAVQRRAEGREVFHATGGTQGSKRRKRK
jgi:hypothetical protein